MHLALHPAGPNFDLRAPDRSWRRKAYPLQGRTAPASAGDARFDCPPGHRQHGAVVLRAFIPAVCLARCIRRESLIDRRLDPPTALAIWLVNHIGRPLLGQTPAHLASLWGAKAPPS